MATPVPLAVRSLVELVRRAVDCGIEGDVMMRERDGSVHRITLSAGRVVDARVAGRFDPLLARLRAGGDLSPEGWRRTLEALGRSGRPSGQLAEEVTGVDRATVRRALAVQIRERFTEVMRRAGREGREAWLRRRPVPPRERAASLSALDLLGRASVAARQTTSRESREVGARIAAPRGREAPDRRALRRLARRLHPDRNGHLDPETRAALAARLAEATARHHGLG